MQRGASTLPLTPVAIIFLLIALGCLFIYQLLSRAITDRFPVLEPGWYEGRIAGEVVGAVRPVPIAVDVGEDGKQLRIITLLTPPLAQNLVIDSVMPEKESRPPLALELINAGAQSTSNDDTYRLKLTGKRVQDRRYSGLIENMNTGQSGQWELRQLLDPSSTYGFGSPSRIESSATSEQVREERDWLQLRSQVATLQERHNFLLNDINIIQSEIDRLSEFVAQSSELRDQAKQERQVLTTALATLTSSRAKNELELERITRQISLKVKYSPLGRIVALGDNILEREARWLEAALSQRGATSDFKTQEDLLLQRGEEVLKLQEQISQLNRKLKLRHQYKEPPPDGANYWRDLQ